MRTSPVLLLPIILIASLQVQSRPVNERRRELQLNSSTNSTKTTITIPPAFFEGDKISAAFEPLSSYNASRCSICREATVMADFLPTPYEELAQYFPPNLTCGQWEQMAQEYVPLEDCGGVQTLYPQCCAGDIPLYTCEANIRKQILQDYDFAVPPIKGIHSPLDIIVNFEYHAVNSIDVQAGTITLFFSIELEWKDERLRWEIGPDTCADYISMFAGMDQETTELWVPDMELYNQVDGIQAMPAAMAQVFSDGTVYWSRTGGLTAFCSFTGLSQIPFDVMGCQLLVGPWSRLDPRLIRYNLKNGTGLSFGRFKSTFNEYLPVYELAESGKSFEGALLYFNFYFKRSQQYYVFNLLVPTIILTYVSFGTFLLDLRVGERLSYGMALTLVVVAQQIATGGMIPVSNERLWIDKFIGWSFYWVIFGLVESVCVGYIYFLREDRAEEKRDEIYDGMTTTPRKNNPPTNNGDDHEEGGQNGEGNGAVNATTESSHQHLPEQSSSQIRSSALGEHNKDIPLTLKKKLQLRTYELNTARSITRAPAPPSPAPPDDDYLPTSPWTRWVYTVSLRKMDRFFFLFTLATYTLYIIAMFISRPYWGQSFANPWANENTTRESTSDVPGEGF